MELRFAQEIDVIKKRATPTLLALLDWVGGTNQLQEVTRSLPPSISQIKKNSLSLLATNIQSEQQEQQRHYFLFKPGKLEWIDHDLSATSLAQMSTQEWMLYAREHHLQGIDERFGLPLTATNAAWRNYLVAEVSQLLDLELVPPTSIIQYREMYGSLQAIAPGEHLYQAEDIFSLTPSNSSSNSTTYEKKREELQQQKTKLQQLQKELQQQLHSQFKMEAKTKKQKKQDRGAATPNPSLLAAYSNSLGLLQEKEKQLTYWSEHYQKMIIEEKKFLIQSAAIPQKKIIAIAPIDLSRPTLRKQLFQAQLLDYLCGQVDRHSFNILFEQDQIHLIDNDQSFIPASSKRQPRLPLFMDALLGERVLKLCEEEFRVILEGLSRAEISAALIRLKQLQQELERLRSHREQRGFFWIEEWEDWSPQQTQFLVEQTHQEKGWHYWIMCDQSQKIAHNLISNQR